MQDYAPCLGSSLKDFTINIMKKKTGLRGIVKIFSVDFNLIDVNKMLDTHRYLWKGK